MNKSEEINIKEKDDGVYVIQEIDISDESEPEDIRDIDSFDDNYPEDNDIENLDKLMTATSKSNSNKINTSLFF